MWSWRALASTATLAALTAVALTSQAATAAPPPDRPGSRAAEVAAYWTAAKRAEAIPRDVIVDDAGRSTIAGRPHGKGRLFTLEAAKSPTTPQKGKPGGGSSDSMPPSISGLDPAAGATLTAADRTFTATVTDASGVKSVSFVITFPDNSTRSYPAASSGGDQWSVSFTGFSAGDWAWTVVATDNAPRGGNTATKGPVPFTVDLGGATPPPAGDDVANAQWTNTSAVQTASGRLLFEMPTSKRGNRWQAYVCSATVVGDRSLTDGRSLILTAAHCVYDEDHGFFARNVMFIPDQQESGSATDSNCSNDVMGCWVPAAGVVDGDWTTHAWPDNIPWDYGYYVVANSGAHWGTAASSDALELAVTPMTIRFSAPTDSGASAFGYSYNQDPKQMYCSQTRAATNGGDNWWLDQCGLTGGASGGPWLDEYPAAGTGEIVSVNSWGYSSSPGMAGPKLDGSSGTNRNRLPICVYNAAAAMTDVQNTAVSTC